MRNEDLLVHYIYLFVDKKPPSEPDGMTAEILPFDLWSIAEAAAERLGLYAVFTAAAAEGIAEALEVAPMDTPPGTPADGWGPNWTIYRDLHDRSAFLCDNIRTGTMRTFGSITAALEWVVAERRAGRPHCPAEEGDVFAMFGLAGAWTERNDGRGASPGNSRGSFRSGLRYGIAQHPQGRRSTP